MRFWKPAARPQKEKTAEGELVHEPDYGVAGREGSGRFTSTRWSLVLAAGDTSTPNGRDCLNELCRAYWFPLYSYIRRLGSTPEESEDLTQAFLTWLIQSRHLRDANPKRGRFRSFLLVRLKHFLSDQRKRDRAQKRGGGRECISLDSIKAEERWDLEPTSEWSPEAIFDRHWALAMMDQTVSQLRAEYTAAGQAELFDQLKEFQAGDATSLSYAEAAHRLGLTESAIKSAIWRLRKRHRDLLRAAVEATVAAPSEVDDEIRYLISVLCREPSSKV